MTGNGELGVSAPVIVDEVHVVDGVGEGGESVTHSDEEFVARVGIVEDVIVGADLEIRRYG